MNKTFLWLSLILVGLVAGAILFYMPLGSKSPVAVGPVLSVGSVSGNPGATVDLPISFTSGTNSVSSLQFDLAIPSGLSYISMVTGSAASSAGKSVQVNQNGANLRIIVFGLNQNSISSGLLATVQFSIDPQTTSGSRTVTLSGIVASSPAAVAVPVSGSHGEVKIL